MGFLGVATQSPVVLLHTARLTVLLVVVHLPLTQVGVVWTQLVRSCRQVGLPQSVLVRHVTGHLPALF